MDIVVGKPIGDPFESRLLFVKDDLAVFQGRSEAMPEFYWVQTKDGEVVFFSDRLERCIETVF